MASLTVDADSVFRSPDTRITSLVDLTLLPVGRGHSAPQPAESLVMASPDVRMTSDLDLT